MIKTKSLTFFLAFLLILCSSCGEPKAVKKELDLMKHGLPIKINAPEDAKVVVEDLGIMKDVTITSGDNYNVQLFSGETLESDPTAKAKALQSEVRNQAYFSEIVKEEEHGFIFKKDIDGNIDYDFRYVRIAAGQDYIFQTGLYGTQTLEQVEAMYESVK